MEKIITTDGVICNSNFSLHDVMQLKTLPGDMIKTYTIEHRGKGKYFVPWSTIEKRIEKLEQQLEDIKERLERLHYLKSKLKGRMKNEKKETKRAYEPLY